MAKKKQTNTDPAVLATFGGAALEDAMRFDADTVERMVADTTTALVQVVGEFRKRVGDLKAKGTLTPKGVSKEAREIAEARLAPETPGPLQRIGVAERDLRDRYRPELEELEAALKVAKKPGETLVAELRAREVRERLATMSEDEALAHFHRAVSEGDAEVYDAITGAPGVYRMVNGEAPSGPFGIPPELLELGAETWDTKRDSKLAKRVRRLRGMIDRLENTIRVSRQEIFDIAGIEDDPVASMAAAGAA